MGVVRLLHRCCLIAHSRVPDECGERTCASGTSSGTQRKKREAQHWPNRTSCGPGSRLFALMRARPGHKSIARASSRHPTPCPTARIQRALPARSRRSCSVSFDGGCPSPKMRQVPSACCSSIHSGGSP